MVAEGISVCLMFVAPRVRDLCESRTHAFDVIGYLPLPVAPLRRYVLIEHKTRVDPERCV